MLTTSVSGVHAAATAQQHQQHHSCQGDKRDEESKVVAEETAGDENGRSGAERDVGEMGLRRGRGGAIDKREE